MTSGRWLPDDIYEIADSMIDIAGQMVVAVQRQAKTQPSPSGLYAVAVVMDADGNIVGRDGRPIVFTVQPGVANVSDNGKVAMFHPDQHLSPKNVAGLADVHIATVWRAVKDGSLPKPLDLSARRRAFRLADVQRWFGVKSSRKVNGSA